MVVGGGSQGHYGWVHKISLPMGFLSRTVHPVASCYSDCAIMAHHKSYYALINIKIVVKRYRLGLQRQYLIWASMPVALRLRSHIWSSNETCVQISDGKNLETHI